MTIKDDLIKLQADVDVIKAATATPPTATVDLSPVLTAVAGVQADTTAIKAEFVATAPVA